jgi:adenosylcobinamide kinase / adenosylcobinamide-phosphate guanylyltransferase
MSKRIMVLGGARSGKSSFALSEASSLPGKKAFLATAEALDEEMAARIARHKTERSPDWTTFEEPVELPSLISRIAPDHPVILIDCLTLWVSNILVRGLDIDHYAGQFMEAIADPGVTHLYIVSNEVGLGLVPEVPLGRQYRDDLGRLNTAIAAAATDVYFMIAGIPMKLKGRDI